MEYIESVTLRRGHGQEQHADEFPPADGRVLAQRLAHRLGQPGVFRHVGVTGARFEARIDDMVPGFSGKWLLEGKTQYPGLIETNGKKYQIHGNIIRSTERGEGAERASWASPTGVDVDGLRRHTDKIRAGPRPVVATIVIDNYDEMIKNQPDRVKNELRDAVEDRITPVRGGKDAVLRRYDRDRYLFIFESRPPGPDEGGQVPAAGARARGRQPQRHPRLRQHRPGRGRQRLRGGLPVQLPGRGDGPLPRRATRPCEEPLQLRVLRRRRATRWRRARRSRAA